MAEGKPIFAALMAVQAELKAPKNQHNSFGKYDYRSAEDIIEAVKPLLKENGLFLNMSTRLCSSAIATTLRPLSRLSMS